MNKIQSFLDFIKSFLDFINGKKTYMVALLAIVYFVSAGLTGHLDWNNAIEGILAALGAVGFRSAMNK